MPGRRRPWSRRHNGFVTSTATPVLRGGRRYARSAILVLHGGQEHNASPTSRWQLSYLRMLDMYVGLRRWSRECAVYSLRYAVRGWNDSLKGTVAPVMDTRWALDRITSTHPGVPIALLGHSMGGRTAFAVADHPDVVGLCALAPWLPKTEPLPQRLDKRFVIAHGTADPVTSPALSAAYARRLQHAGASIARFELAAGGHALLDRPALWHRFAVRTTLGLVGDLDLPAGVARALAGDSEAMLALPLEDFG
jgi:pimeloyl-ACP methyl ester carboxylesterase